MEVRQRAGFGTNTKGKVVTLWGNLADTTLTRSSGSSPVVGQVDLMSPCDQEGCRLISWSSYQEHGLSRVMRTHQPDPE